MSDWLRQYVPDLEWPSGRRTVLFEKAKPRDMSYCIHPHFLNMYEPFKIRVSQEYLYLRGFTEVRVRYNTEGRAYLWSKPEWVPHLRFMPELIDGFDIYIEKTSPIEIRREFVLFSPFMCFINKLVT